MNGYAGKFESTHSGRFSITHKIFTMKKQLLTLVYFAVSMSLFGQISIGQNGVYTTNETRVNSPELEYSPVFYKDGIVFISTRRDGLNPNLKEKDSKGVNIMTIFRSQRDAEGFLLPPAPLALELTTHVHEGPVSFDRTAETIYFTRNEMEHAAPDGLKKLQIYQAQKSGSAWTNVQKLPFNYPNYNYLHPTVSADEDVMFIASDIPGGHGGMDLYAVYKLNGEWSQLFNLGKNVNTPGNEVFPYVAADGTLYFSSDGHGGAGKLDIFYTTQNMQDETWSAPVNLGDPFNSPDDDFGFIVDRDNKNGYFSSNRMGGYGGDDIYSFYMDGGSRTIASGHQQVKGLTVRDENGNPLRDASVSTISFDEISLYAEGGQLVKLLPGSGGRDNFILDVKSGGMGESSITGADGRAGVSIKKGNYVLKVTKDGYEPAYITVSPTTNFNTLNIQLRRAANCVQLTGRIWMEGGRIPVSGAEVHVVDVESQEAIIIYSDARGQYDYCLPCNRNYSVYAVKNGASSSPGIASTKKMPCTKGEKINLPLYLGGTPLFAGMTIELPSIYFNFDDATLRPDAYRDLDEVAGMLMSYPGMKLELASHTDARGAAAYNLDLSERRSASVFRYLTSAGVPAHRLEPRGYGERQIRNRCTDGVACTEAEHQYNRRTEIKILEIGTPLAGSLPIAGMENTTNDDFYLTENEAYSGSAAEGKGGQELGVPIRQRETMPGVKVNEKSIAGNYAVIAGTFANYDYATRRATLLTGLGYSETTIVKQERNGLYAVWVKTFSEKSRAFSLVKTLAGQQLAAYVLKR